MKKKLMITGALLLVLALAIPAFAFGPGWGRGGGPSNCARYGGPEITDEQRQALEDVRKEFFQSTEGLRESMRAKMEEMREVMTSDDPDEDKAKAISKEISQLRSELSEKRIDMALKVRKIIPDAPFGKGSGSGFGKRGGRGGRGWSRGGGGFGPGNCWN